MSRMARLMLALLVVATPTGCADTKAGPWECALDHCEAGAAVHANAAVADAASQVSTSSPVSFHGFGYAGRERVVRATAQTLRGRPDCGDAPAFVAEVTDNWSSPSGKEYVAAVDGELALKVEVSCWSDGTALWGATGWVAAFGPDGLIDTSDLALFSYFPSTPGWTDPGSFLVMGSEWEVTADAVLEAGGVPPDQVSLIHPQEQSLWTFEFILWLITLAVLASSLVIAFIRWRRRAHP